MDTLHFLPELNIFCTGCFYGPEKLLLEKIEENHKKTEHYKPYLAAIKALKEIAKAKGIKRTKQKKGVLVG